MLLIGEAPSRTGDPGAPLSGRIGQRLADLSGLTLDEYLRATKRLNLFQQWHGAAGKGSAFPLDEAREAAFAVRLKHFRMGQRVLLLGKRVASAFGMRQPDYLKWYEVGGVQVAVIPHPSGINRWYNSESNRWKLCRFLAEHIRGERNG